MFQYIFLCFRKTTDSITNQPLYPSFVGQEVIFLNPRDTELEAEEIVVLIDPDTDSY